MANCEIFFQRKPEERDVELIMPISSTLGVVDGVRKSRQNRRFPLLNHFVAGVTFIFMMLLMMKSSNCNITYEFSRLSSIKSFVS